MNLINLNDEQTNNITYYVLDNLLGEWRLDAYKLVLQLFLQYIRKNAEKIKFKCLKQAI